MEFSLVFLGRMEKGVRGMMTRQTNKIDGIGILEKGKI
jgi:hypothetical protein